MELPPIVPFVSGALMGTALSLVGIEILVWHGFRWLLFYSALVLSFLAWALTYRKEVEKDA